MVTGLLKDLQPQEKRREQKREKKKKLGVTAIRPMGCCFPRVSSTLLKL